MQMMISGLCKIYFRFMMPKDKIRIKIFNLMNRLSMKVLMSIQAKITALINKDKMKIKKSQLKAKKNKSLNQVLQIT